MIVELNVSEILEGCSQSKKVLEFLLSDEWDGTRRLIGWAHRNGDMTDHEVVEAILNASRVDRSEMSKEHRVIASRFMESVVKITNE